MKKLIAAACLTLAAFGASAERADSLKQAGINFDSLDVDEVTQTRILTGNVVQCGTASVPSWSPPPMGPRNEREVLTRRLHWSGFVIFDHVRRFDAVVDELATLVSAGSLVFDEHITSGIETAPDALRALYAGENEGKRLIFLG